MQSFCVLIVDTTTVAPDGKGLLLAIEDIDALCLMLLELCRWLLPLDGSEIYFTALEVDMIV